VVAIALYLNEKHIAVLTVLMYGGILIYKRKKERKKKKRKSIIIGKEYIKLSLFTDDMIAYVNLREP